MRVCFSSILSLFLLLSILPPLHAQTVGESFDSVLDSVTVSARVGNSVLKSISPGHIMVDYQKLATMPQILGNADPLRIVQFLPGVQTSGEYDGGLHVQGSDNGHNEIQIDGVPLYNPNHLLNLFSSLNTSHFTVMELRKNSAGEGFSNRLGGIINVRASQSRPDKVKATLNLGMLETNMSLNVPLGKRSALSISPRLTYANLLYAKLFTFEGYPGGSMRYGFQDVNASLSHWLPGGDLLQFDSYFGGDDALFSSPGVNVNADGAWSNNMQALRWNHSSSSMQMNHTLYRTHYAASIDLDDGASAWAGYAGLTDFGYKGRLKFSGNSVDVLAILHHTTPQARMIEGEWLRPDRQSGLETGISYARAIPLSTSLSLNASAQANLYLSGAKAFPSVDPSVSLCYHNSTNESSISLYRRHQYSFKTGFSNTGLPTEYWLLSDSRIAPQYADVLSLSSTQDLMRGIYSVAVELYGKLLYNQVEYGGTVLDMAEINFDVYNRLLVGKGWNYGGSVTLSKNAGILTGWLSYSYGRALREFHQGRYDGIFPASHERPHELNAVLNWTPAKGWNASATFVYASGTPYTAPEEFYYVNGSMLTRYSDLNAYRLNPYSRADISLTYSWKGGLWNSDQKLTASVYNLFCHKNELCRLITANNGQFWVRSFSFVRTMLPSLSYSISF